MQRYFVETNYDEFYLTDDDSHHIINVMRQKIGDEIEVVIDGKLYICEIIDTEKKRVKVRKKTSKKTDSELPCQVTIAQSLVKEQKMDLILQKCCELGVSDIIPLITTRSIVKLEKENKKKMERWQRIVKEASEQSKRLVIPRVNDISSIEELVKKNYDIKLLCTVNEVSTTIKKVLSKDIIGARIIIVIGPEGGFTKEEEETFIENGFISISLGNRILRTETASIYVLSIINYVLMR